MFRAKKFLSLFALITLALACATTELKEIPGVAPLAAEPGALQVTWYGVTTLLFDDGETQILIDGFFSRPKITASEEMPTEEAFLATRTTPDVAKIDSIIAEAGLDRLAAVTAVHSHFDHAMDLGVIAKKTGAVVVGSDSTANVARGAGVDEGQIRTVDDSGEFEFGAFRVSLIRSAHGPFEDGGPPIPGTIDAPLVPPAAIGDWKEGGSYTVVLTHPEGTVVVQGSAGYLPGALNTVPADTVYLGVGGLEMLGQEHATQYFAEVVSATEPLCVVLVHWDDFMTTELGEVAFTGSSAAIEWIRTATQAEGIGLAAPTYGVPMNPFASSCRPLRARR